jgi:hypothetical protein
MADGEPAPECAHSGVLHECQACGAAVCSKCIHSCWLCDDEGGRGEGRAVYCGGCCEFVCDRDDMEYHGGHFLRACWRHRRRGCPMC